MKVSIITVVFNNRPFIEDCIRSVLNQTYRDIEYIVIDGGSTDGTRAVISKYEKYISRCVSEPDQGLYDAMNKGIGYATGDVIGILNSDDVYADEKVISKVADCFLKTQKETCYGDLVYVDYSDINRVTRYWKSGHFHKDLFQRGWMPPHPTFFVRRQVYDKHARFNLSFPRAADYELMLRYLYVNDLSTAYIPECLVKMRTGGKSRPGVANTVHHIMENYYAWKVNNLKINPLTFILKPVLKTIQYVRRNDG